MPMTKQRVTSEAIKEASEKRDARTLASFYADDAVIRIIDRENPPSHPRELRGKEAIAAFWDEVCKRDMTHKVETSVADDNRLAFAEACAYPGGMKVFAMAMAELKNGSIAKQTLVQAWDE
jgi:ketosteroid isomerase-like protein